MWYKFKKGCVTALDPSLAGAKTACARHGISEIASVAVLKLTAISSLLTGIYFLTSGSSYFPSDVAIVFQIQIAEPECGTYFRCGICGPNRCFWGWFGRNAYIDPKYKA